MTDGVFKPLLLLPKGAPTPASAPVHATWRLPDIAGRTLITLARAAAVHGFSHIIHLSGAAAACAHARPEPLQTLLTAARTEPQAIIMGYPRSRPASLFGALSRQWRRLWLRIQTGRQLPDSRSAWAVYPLPLLVYLPLWPWRHTLQNELLVRAAWGGVVILPLQLEPFENPSGSAASGFQALFAEGQLALLNFFLTLRAMLPWPHRRIPGLSPASASIQWRHPIQSLRRLQQQNISARALGAAGALGVFLGALPLFALHTVTILFSAGYLGLNRMVALSASQLCMPPLVPALCIGTGYYLRHGRLLTEFSIQTLGYQAHERLWEWLLGSLLLAPVLALIAGLLMYGGALLVFSKNGGKRR